MTCCGSGSGSGNGITNASNASLQETGPADKIVPVPGTATAVVAIFPDGKANYSPDGFNLGGGGATISAYSGQLQVLDVVAVASGVDALFSDGSVFFSPDGKDLGGGGRSVSAYSGGQAITSLVPVGAGVDAIFANGASVYYSPDGLNLGGGGRSILIYSAGHQGVAHIIAVGPGDAVDTLFADGSVFYSPDNRNLADGGATVSATGGSHLTVQHLVQVGGGVLAEFGNGSVYLSPDGQNLAGGGRTIQVLSWNTAIADGPFAARDSAYGAEFLGRLWLSGGYADSTNSNSCFTTCSFFDLWSSTDIQGATWNPTPSFATTTTPDPRDASPVVNGGVQDVAVPTDFYDPYSALVVWNGELTAIGSSVWRSSDGVSWVRNNQPDGSASPGPLSQRASENSRAAVAAASLFVIQTDTGEVYRSSDAHAAVWADLGAIPGFAPRCGAAVFAMSGKIWIEGGGACDYSQVYHDIWSSSDGTTWMQNGATAAWSARMWPCVASGDGITWLAAGYAPTDWNNTGGTVVPRYGANHADVWYTRDGSNWKQFKADVGSSLSDDGGLEPRHAPTCYVAGAAPARNLVIIAGTGGSDPNDASAEVLNSIRAVPLPQAASLP
ncbi:MAG TPA: hypothetical protein VI195_08155 [Steroidobacteraceae bacterium]